MIEQVLQTTHTKSVLKLYALKCDLLVVRILLLLAIYYNHLFNSNTARVCEC